MELVVRAFPVLPGKEDQMRRFIAEATGARGKELADFYRRMGVARESWHVQQHDHGTWVIGVTQIHERPVEAAAHDYAGSRHPFDAWFKAQVQELTGVDPETAPLGPPTECVFDTARLAP